jgi:hypothetical protein
MDKLSFLLPTLLQQKRNSYAKLLASSQKKAKAISNFGGEMIELLRNKEKGLSRIGGIQNKTCEILKD